MFILLNFTQNSFYTKLIFVLVNSSSFSLLISLPKTPSHCWKWHMALHEKMAQSGKCLQGTNSSLPALIPQCLPPHYYSWNLWSRADPATPPRTVLWLLGSRVIPPQRGLFSPVKNAGEIGERASLTYFSSSSHPSPSYTHISAPTSKLHIHPRIFVGWWKKKICRQWGTEKQQHFSPYFCMLRKAESWSDYPPFLSLWRMKGKGKKHQNTNLRCKIIVALIVFAVHNSPTPTLC